LTQLAAAVAVAAAMVMLVGPGLVAVPTLISGYAFCAA
jgi:hypothetical protein